MRVGGGGGGGLGVESVAFHFWNCKKGFVLRKYKNLFNIRVRKSHFQKYKEFFAGWIFFVFLVLNWEVWGYISGDIILF